MSSSPEPAFHFLNTCRRTTISGIIPHPRWLQHEIRSFLRKKAQNPNNLSRPRLLSAKIPLHPSPMMERKRTMLLLRRVTGKHDLKLCKLEL